MIQSIEHFIEEIRNGSSDWHPQEPKWFRAEPLGTLTPLLPTLYRDGLGSYENPLLQMFRARASGFHDILPAREDTDQWLFLARHAGLPTRLLDWSEGALLALHFALKKEKSVVWMMNPHELNALSYGPESSRPREFPLPWVDPTKACPPGRPNPAFENLAGAWEQGRRGVPLPIAVYPTYVHPRLRGQRSCFTIHGTSREGLNSLVSGNILKRYDLDPARREAMLSELQLLGITDSVLFPDLDGLADELKERFREPKTASDPSAAARS